MRTDANNVFRDLQQILEELIESMIRIASTNQFCTSSNVYMIIMGPRFRDFLLYSRVLTISTPRYVFPVPGGPFSSARLMRCGTLNQCELLSEGSDQALALSRVKVGQVDQFGD